MTEELKTGSLQLSTEMHAFISSLVNSDSSLVDNPFESIVEGFRFAFSLGYLHGKTKKIGASSQGIAPRGFVAKDYEVLIADQCQERGISLGGLISEYAEAGVEIMAEHQSSGGTILDLLFSDIG
jgi:hypothetical protein